MSITDYLQTTHKRIQVVPQSEFRNNPNTYLSSSDDLLITRYTNIVAALCNPNLKIYSFVTKVLGTIVEDPKDSTELESRLLSLELRIVPLTYLSKHTKEVLDQSQFNPFNSPLAYSLLTDYNKLSRIICPPQISAMMIKEILVPTQK